MPASAAFLARHRAQRVDVLADRLVEIIQAASPGYLEGLVPTDDLRRSCHDNIARVLELLELAVTDQAVAGDVYDAARATGHRRAEQGLPLDAVLRSFRLGGRLIWEDLVQEGGSELDPEALRRVGTYLWQVVDETSAQVALAYHETEHARVRGDEQRRAELWEGLLGGRGSDPVFAHEAGHVLDLPSVGRYAVIAVEGGLPGPPWSTLAGASVRWIRRSPGTVGVVRLGSSDLAAVVAGLARLDGVPIGCSGTVADLAGIGRGYREAVLALRTTAGRPGVACFDDRLPEAMLLDAPDVARRLVGRWLGPVLELPGPERGPLLDTLRRWVDAGGSTTQTARATHCHRNTVLNRLARVSRLLGTPLVEGPPPLELALALRAHGLVEVATAPD